MLAAEFWVSQNPETKECKTSQKKPDGTKKVMIGATSYPTLDAAKAAKDVAVEAGQCIKKNSAGAPSNP